MKKLLLLLLSCLLVFSFSTFVYSQEPLNQVYVSLNGGISFIEDADTSYGSNSITIEGDRGLALSSAIGYRSGPSRVEVEISYQKNDFDKTSGGVNIPLSGDVSALSLLANYYYDFDTNTNFFPFIGFGLGVSRLDVDDLIVSNLNLGGHDTVLAGQLTAGVACAIQENISIELKYRYFATEDPEFDGVESEYSNHNILLGVRFYF